MTIMSAQRVARDQHLWRNTTVALEAWKKAENTPERIALFLEHEPDATYGALALEARRLITALQQLGLEAGDVVSFQLPNWREAAPIDIAAAALGLVVNPIVPIYRDKELRYILEDAGTRLIYIPDQYRSIDYINMLMGLREDLPELQHLVTVRAERSYEGCLRFEDLVTADPVDEKALPPVDPNSPKCRLYTSGTTGFPKAVLHSHNTLSYVQETSARHADMQAGDVMLMPSPVTHITGYSSGVNMCFMSDVQSALMERWNADDAIDIVHRVGATMTVGATPFLQELLDAAERRNDPLPTLRRFSCGGAAVPPSLVQRAYRALPGCVTARVYGSTEVPMVSYGWRDNPERAATTDGHLFAYEVRVLDDQGQDVAEGEDGELAVRGGGMFLGYADPQQTLESHTGDGFFLTGDIGHVCPDSAVVITDRKKDLIIRGGENLSAKEIENVLHLHAGIREAAVVAMPHERLGEGVCAFIIVNDADAAPDAASIIAFTETQGLARQKTPERIEFVDELPKTPSGKVRKDQLRKQLWGT
ncbi:MAG: AMP-binding protein [Halieaceae bacterium]